MRMRPWEWTKNWCSKQKDFIWGKGGVGHGCKLVTEAQKWWKQRPSCKNYCRTATLQDPSMATSLWIFNSGDQTHHLSWISCLIPPWWLQPAASEQLPGAGGSQAPGAQHPLSRAGSSMAHTAPSQLLELLTAFSTEPSHGEAAEKHRGKLLQTKPTFIPKTKLKLI